MKPESIVKVSETVGYHDLIVNMIRRQGGGASCLGSNGLIIINIIHFFFIVDHDLVFVGSLDEHEDHP